MTENKKAKLEKCAVLKANGGRCWNLPEDKAIIDCGFKTEIECPVFHVCDSLRFQFVCNKNPSTELIAARLAAVAEYEAKNAEPEEPLLLKDDTEKLEAMKNGAVYVDHYGCKIGFDEDFYFEHPNGLRGSWVCIPFTSTSNWTLKTPAQPHKLTTPTRDQLLTWVCSADALGWVVNVFIDFLDAWEIYPVQSNTYLDDIECNQFSRTSPTGEYIWHRTMWDSVSGKIVMVPVEG